MFVQIYCMCMHRSCLLHCYGGGRAEEEKGQAIVSVQHAPLLEAIFLFASPSCFRFRPVPTWSGKQIPQRRSCFGKLFWWENGAGTCLPPPPVTRRAQGCRRPSPPHRPTRRSARAQSAACPQSPPRTPRPRGAPPGATEGGEARSSPVSASSPRPSNGRADHSWPAPAPSRRHFLCSVPLTEKAKAGLALPQGGGPRDRNTFPHPRAQPPQLPRRGAHPTRAARELTRKKPASILTPPAGPQISLSRHALRQPSARASEPAPLLQRFSDSSLSSSRSEGEGGRRAQLVGQVKGLANRRATRKPEAGGAPQPTRRLVSETGRGEGAEAGRPREAERASKMAALLFGDVTAPMSETRPVQGAALQAGRLWLLEGHAPEAWIAVTSKWWLKWKLKHFQSTCERFILFAIHVG